VLLHGRMPVVAIAGSMSDESKYEHNATIKT